MWLYLSTALFIVGAGRAAAQSDGESAVALAIFNQAQNLHEKGDLRGAIALYEKSLKVLPEFPEAEYQRGIAYLALGSFSDAEKAFRRALAVRPDWGLAMVSLGSLLVDRNQLPEAETLLQGVLKLEPQNAPALAAMVDVRLRTGAKEQDLRQLLEMITALTGRANPTVALWTARAALERALGSSGAARKSIESALSIDPNSVGALFQLADIAVVEGDTSTANEIAARLENRPAIQQRLNLLRANIFASEGKLDEATKHLDLIKDVVPAATALRDQINLFRTATPPDMEKALESNPRNIAILGRLCAVFRKDDPPKAIAYCRRASEAEPGNIAHAIGFGAALVQAKQYVAAVNLLKKLTVISSDNVSLRANLATALFQLKRYSEAKQEFRWLITAQPKSPAAYYFLGIVHDQLGEYIDAMANYQQYLRLADPLENKLEMDKVNLRLPALQKLLKDGKGRKDS
ncbi:MAG: tetratricopeptide repeat protein [Pyrinomonadaceae bacterium]